MRGLNRKRVIITGGASGIGRAICARLGEEGCRVGILDLDGDGAEKVANEIRESGGHSQALPCDISDYDAVKTAISKIEEDAGPSDILVNNAGTNIPEHFTKIQKKNLEYLVKLNTMATFHIAQLCALKMLETKNRKKIGGSIINMSSQMGHVGGPNRSVYNMTKFGLEGLTKGMAIDLAKNNIRVNTICPTFVNTPMTKGFFKNKKFKVEVLNKIPLGRIAEVSDVATAVAFLASDASSMITGTSLLVDGGWTAW